jgi:hypothetical protein
LWERHLAAIYQIVAEAFGLDDRGWKPLPQKNFAPTKV